MRVVVTMSDDEAAYLVWAGIGRLRGGWRMGDLVRVAALRGVETFRPGRVPRGLQPLPQPASAGPFQGVVSMDRDDVRGVRRDSEDLAVERERERLARLMRLRRRRARGMGRAMLRYWDEERWRGAR